jgi:hypothetical protein
VWTNPYPRPLERHGGKRHWQAAMAARWSLRSNNQTENGSVLMSSTQQEFDRKGHTPGCAHYSEGPPLADESTGHVDFYCDDCHDFTEPRILPDGTSIAWPSGWTPEQALVWRDQRGLAAPSPI